MASWMRALSGELGAPLGFVLEGGYDLTALAASVAATLDAALAENGSDPGQVDPGQVVIRARDHYRRWWPVLGQ
jgi:acetoin utilization deacetylase AcuC-like enzyme